MGELWTLYYGALASWFIAGIVWWVRKFVLALGIELAGIFLWLALLLSYGLKARYWPLSTPGEFFLVTLGFAALIHLMAEIMVRGKGAGWMTPFAMAMLALWGKETLRTVPFPPPPAFNSIWFQFHTLTASAAYGAFLVAGATALGAILRPDREPYGLTEEMAVGYFLLTLSMLIGALWGQLTWGNYWAWNLKELWTLALWLMATLYFHVRPLHWWKGRKAWILVTFMAGVMLFSLLGTAWLARKLTLETLYIF